MRSLFFLLVVLAAGATSLWTVTGGLRSFTAESARRLAVLEDPRPLPDVPLMDMMGRTVHLSDLQGQPLVVDFIFTRCSYICYAMGSALEQLRAGLPETGPSASARILSISFDPAYDGPAELAEYAGRYDADGRMWNVAVVSDPAQLQPLLETFGITVVPLEDGGFEHNAALHLVDATGQLVDIRDFEDVSGMLASLENHAAGDLP